MLQPSSHLRCHLPTPSHPQSAYFLEAVDAPTPEKPFPTPTTSVCGSKSQVSLRSLNLRHNGQLLLANPVELFIKSLISSMEVMFTSANALSYVETENY